MFLLQASVLSCLKYIKCLAWECEVHNFGGHLINTPGLPETHMAAAVLQKLVLCGFVYFCVFLSLPASVAHLCCPKYENQPNLGNVLHIKCTINAMIN